MQESWCDNELRSSILIKNENELLWSSADNIILVIYPIKFIFSCLFYSGWIGSGLIRFGLFRVRVYIRSIRVRVSSDLVRFISGYGSNWVNKISGQFGFDLDHYSFGSVQFQISDWNQFNSFLCRLRSDFGSFGSGQSSRITFATFSYNLNSD